MLRGLTPSSRTSFLKPLLFYKWEKDHAWMYVFLLECERNDHISLKSLDTHQTMFVLKELKKKKKEVEETH